MAKGLAIDINICGSSKATIGQRAACWKSKVVNGIATFLIGISKQGLHSAGALIVFAYTGSNEYVEAYISGNVMF